jgi:hypothetical protein
MARAITGPGAGFKGSVDDLSFYKMRGVEGTIVRRKGGPSKEQVKELSTILYRYNMASGEARLSIYLPGVAACVCAIRRSFYAGAHHRYHVWFTDR